MRPSNKRSRSKQNRPRPLGNIVNRVFDSSGPEGKVRGTPQQIIDKYLALSRDAQLSGDRVAAENFSQHAEHYLRMLNEAQAEMAREAELRREQGGPNPGQNGGYGQPRRPDETDDRQNDRPADRRDNRHPDGRQADGRQQDGRSDGRIDFLGRRNRRFDTRGRAENGQRDGVADAETALAADSLLVDTPEGRSEDRPAPRVEPVPDREAPGRDAATESAAPRTSRRAPAPPADTAEASAAEAPPADRAVAVAATPAKAAADAPAVPPAEPARRASRRRKPAAAEDKGGASRIEGAADAAE